MEWKNISENYRISSTGLVYSVRRDIILKPDKNSKGYLRVVLDNKRRKFIHRLVATYFVPNPLNLPEVNHKDGNKLNNNMDNLEWMTGEDNIAHYRSSIGFLSPNAKLTEQQVIEMRKLLETNSIGDVANIYNLKYLTVFKIKHRQSWKHI